ncbi:MAG: hypothetical protein PHP03_02335 [Candidatus Pacebacteria bacterium]|nr:hypothetical protein [Candidatus Paceibacterota bacterium]
MEAGILDVIGTNISGIADIVIDILKESWWFLLPLCSFFIFYEFWMNGKNFLWKIGIKWVLLEIKIPKEILKTPKAMENVFSSLHAIYTSIPEWEEKFLKGMDLKWMSFEMVGNAGTIRFYARVFTAHRNIFESAIYSEYPDAEIKEVEDYVLEMPSIMPNKTYELWGTDYVFTKDNPYPIKTYEFYEEHVEEKRTDPISMIVELMSRLKQGEMIWLQYLIKPIPSDWKNWKKLGEEIRDKMMQRDKAAKKGLLAAITDFVYTFLKNLVHAFVVHPEWPEDKKKEEKFKLNFLSPGEQNVLKAVEQKISKLGFETNIRFLYIDRRDEFTVSNATGVNSAFRQFNTQDMNGFKPGKSKTWMPSLKLQPKTWTKKMQLQYRKRCLFDNYVKRWFPKGWDAPILNTEELATVFHFPIVTVGAPSLRRLETKRGEPPHTLPIE